MHVFPAHECYLCRICDPQTSYSSFTQFFYSFIEGFVTVNLFGVVSFGTFRPYHKCLDKSIKRVSNGNIYTDNVCTCLINETVFPLRFKSFLKVDLKLS